MPLTTEAISGLPVATSLTGVEYAPVVQGGTTKRAQVSAFDLTGTLPGSVQTANTVLAGPTTGSADFPAFRALVAADLPATAFNMIVGTTEIASGTTTRFLYDLAGVLAESAGLTYTAATPSVNAAAHLLFSPDNTYDIGASGATRPRAMYVATNVTAGGSWVGSGDVRVGAASQLYWTGKSLVGSSADGLVELYNNAGTGFTRLNFGGTTSSFPAIKRSSATLAFRLADDSADAAVSGAAAVWSGNQTFATNNTYDIGTFPSTGRPRTGYFGTALVSPILTLTQGTITADASQINGSVTWNDASIVGPAWKLNVTATSSDAAALLMDLQVASTSKFKVDRTGLTTAASMALGGATIGTDALAVTGTASVSSTITGSVQIRSGTLSSALTTLTGSADGFRTSAANVTAVAGENTTASSSTQGAFFGAYSNDGAAMASGDRLGGLRAGGSSSASAIRNSALIGAFADEAWADGSAYGSRWEFQTTTNGATSASTKLILDNAGVLKPNSNGGAVLGTSALMFNGLFLFLDSAINWNNNTLKIASASSGTAMVFSQGSAGSFLGYSFADGPIVTNTPVTKTDDFTVAITQNYLIVNKAGSVTVTLPAAASYTGRAIYIKTIQAQTVVSNASNVVPSTSATAGTAILPATDGAWAMLVSDGTNWIIIAANPLV